MSIRQSADPNPSETAADPREYSAIGRLEPIGTQRCHAKHNIWVALEIRKDNGESRIKYSGDQTANITRKAISAARITTRSLDTLGKARS